MTKKIAFSLFVLFAIAASAFAIPVTHSSSPGAAIVDNGCLDDTNTGSGLGGSTDAINFPETGTINDVNIAVEFDTTWRSDIQAAVTYSVTATTVRLINNYDTSGDDLFAQLDSDAGVLCSDASMCGTGANCVTAPGPVCQPQESLDAAFGATTAPGTFTMAVCDRAAQDNLVWTAWSVTADGTIPVELQGFSIE